VILLCSVAVGVTDIVNDKTSDDIPKGCHSRLIDKKSGVDEIVVPNDDQILPKFLLVF